MPNTNIIPRFKKSVLSIFLLLMIGQLSAQNLINNVDTIAGEFVKAIRKDKSEKITVETNKWYYAAGEDLWLKAWVTNKVSNKFYAHSQNLYVDIVDDRDSTVTQLLLNIPSEHTEGYIRLSDSLPEGHYWLRAFTSNMLKKDINAIFIKPLYIVNAKYPSKLNLEKQAVLNQPTPKADTIVSFYPEGGTVVTGVNMVFGIKAVNELGKPVSVKGYITDNTDSTAITWFNTQANSGLGKTSFFVGANKVYKAHVQLGGKILYYTIPMSDQEGTQLSIEKETPLNLKVVIAQGDALYKKGVNTYIIGLSKDSICFAGVGKDMFELNITKSDFPAGEAKLLLVNDHRKILSERSIYIPNSNLKVLTDKTEYNAREKVTMNIYVGDSVFHPMFSALSIAVTDDSIVKEPIYQDGPTVILSDTNAALNDLIMLTTKPKYAGMYIHEINNQFLDADNQKKDEIEFETIEGTVLNRKNVPVVSRIVTLYTNSKISLFDTDTTNAQGKFSFKIPLHYDTIPFTIQLTNSRGNLVNEKIIIDIRSPFPKLSTPIQLKQRLTVQQSELVTKYRTIKLDSVIVRNGKEWLKDVVVTASIKAKSYNTSKRVSNFSQIMTGEKLQSMVGSNASNAMLMIPGLHLRGGFITLGGVRSFGISAKDEPLLIVDGMMVAGGNAPTGFDEDPSIFQMSPSPVLAELSNIPTDIIDFIEVLKGPEAAFYGTRSSNGVIIVNTHRTSNFRTRLENYGTIQYNSKSYHLAPDFIAPDYENLIFKSTVLNDNRPTIYWNGHLYTNKNGKATVSFYTADRKTSYTVKITGVTVTGALVEKELKIKHN
jgi:hypothetical protein